jgi:uncharacterized protein
MPQRMRRERMMPMETERDVSIFNGNTAPSILGFYTLAIATFIAAVGLARGEVGVPFRDFVSSSAIFFSGLAVLLSAMWAYRMRDSLYTALFGVWGSFFLGYGFLYLAAPSPVTVITVQSVSLGFWFVPLAIITLTMALAAVRINFAVFAVLVLLGFGSAIAAVGFFSGLDSVLAAAGWVMIFSSMASLWTASSLLYEAVMGYSPLPLFRREPVTTEREAGEHITIEH